MPKPLIKLYATEDPGLLILGESGVIYLQQTGCACCFQSADEGWYVPLGPHLTEFQQRIHDVFHMRHLPDPAGPLDPGVADEIDRLLQASPCTKILTVARARLVDSHEAWVYVEIASSHPTLVPCDFKPPRIRPLEDHVPEDGPIVGFFGFQSQHGVLTWSNCD